MKHRAYIYPASSREKNLGLYNPYIDDFILSISPQFEFVNLGKTNNKGVFDFLKYIGKIDYIFLNWIEKIPENKMGYFQTLFFVFIVYLFKAIGIKIIWTMHNKLSHSNDHVILKKLIFKLMLKKSDVILTHSSEGITYGNELVRNSDKKAIYLPHPLKDRRDKPQLNPEKKYDLLIWGTISPYKGIDNFLEELYKNNLQSKYKILIIGKCTTVEYFKTLAKYKNTNIQIRNEFIDDDQLKKLINQSRLVLFTYSKSSILSSGVLMDSIGYGAQIIGPNVGAFSDLEKEGIVTTFENFNQLFEKLPNTLISVSTTNIKINNFLSVNSWEKFGYNFSKLILKN